LLRATTDATEAVLNSEVSFVCVGTPSLKNGKLDPAISRAWRGNWRGDPQKKSPHVFCAAQHGAGGDDGDGGAAILEKESGKKCGADFTVCL